MRLELAGQFLAIAIAVPVLARVLSSLSPRPRAMVCALAVLAMWILPFHVVGLDEVLGGVVRWWLLIPAAWTLGVAWVVGARWMVGSRRHARGSAPATIAHRSRDDVAHSGADVDGRPPRGEDRGALGRVDRRAPGDIDRRTRLAVGLVIASLALFLAAALTGYPSGWDARVYHLPVALGWLQTGSLAMGSAHDWRFALPGNFELTVLSLLAMGMERLATIANLLAYVLACLAVAELAAITTRRRAAVWWTTIIFAALPIAEFQAFSGYLDLFGTSFLLVAAALVARRNQPVPGADAARWRAGMLALAALSIGLAMGTKPTFWVYGALAVIVVGVLAWRDASRARAGANLVGRALALGACVLVISSAFWFVRAAATTGNPVYPLEVTVAGHTLWEGYPHSEITPRDYELEVVSGRWWWLVYPWIESKRSGYAYGTGTGLGALFATFVPMGLLFAGWRFLRDVRCRRMRTPSALLLLTVILALVWCLALRRMPRFGLPVLALAVVAAAPLLATLDRRARSSLRTLGILATVITLAISSFLPAYRLAERLREDRLHRAGTYSYPRLFDETRPGTVIWNLSGSPTDNYPLAGVRLANRVVPNPWPDESVIAGDVLRLARERGAELIVDRAPFRSDLQPSGDLRLAFDARIGDGPTDRWRVWRVRAELPSAESAGGGPALTDQDDP